MKDRLIKDLDRFLEVADCFEMMPFKWYELKGETIIAEIEMTNRSLFWEGEVATKTIKRLDKHKFTETEDR